MGVICHDPRCLPDHTKHPQTAARMVQRLFEVDGDNGDGESTSANGQGHENGNGSAPALPPPPYGIALTAGGKVLRFSLAALAAISTRKGRIVDPSRSHVQGTIWSWGSSRPTAPRTSAWPPVPARVLIFPVTEANVVAGARPRGDGHQARREGPGHRFRPRQQEARGALRADQPGRHQIVRATKYPVTGRGGRGYAILQRGSLECVLPSDAEPVPPQDQVGEGDGKPRSDEPTGPAGETD